MEIFRDCDIGALIVQSGLYSVLCSVTWLIPLSGVCVLWSTVSVFVQCVQSVQCVTGAGAVTYYSLI